MKFSAPHAYDSPAAQAALARLDYILIDLFPAWGSLAKQRAALAAIKAVNPRIVILDYNLYMQVPTTPAVLKPLRDKLDAERWWLYERGAGGTKVCVSGPGAPAGACLANVTDAVPPDANGDRWNTWYAKTIWGAQWRHLPELDGTITDNFFWRPRQNGDWNRDGTTDSHQDLQVGTAWRTGMMTHVRQIRTLMPGKLVTGNIGGWGIPEASVPEYAQQLDGGFLEHYIGATWSQETVSWARMMGAYHKVMGLVGAPKLVIFNMKGNPSNLQTFRYGFASSLMNDAWFDYSDDTGGNIYRQEVAWFDEYDLAGTADSGWLGPAIDPPQTAPWQKGVFRRRFQNGMALVNPKGNGPQAVSVEPGYTRFRGTQAPSVNNGEPAVTISLADRDGLLLRRTASPASLAPPAGLRIQR